ncbi:MAG: hypothetical protein ABIS06_12670 [Vicinamibacterales bacterium]
MPTFTREELYALLWTEPVTKVAARYGFSDRGLGKLCGREGIPVPPRGWWAKKAAGKRLPKQPTLPPIQSGQNAHFTFAPPPPPAPTPDAVPEAPEILFELDPVNEIVVDPNSHITHHWCDRHLRTRNTGMQRPGPRLLNDARFDNV